MWTLLQSVSIGKGAAFEARPKLQRENPQISGLILFVFLQLSFWRNIVLCISVWILNGEISTAVFSEWRVLPWASHGDFILRFCLKKI